MKTKDFDYELPPELIAQTSIERRDASRRFGGFFRRRRDFKRNRLGRRVGLF